MARFNEFQREMQILEETLDKLGEIYGGIEYFSSDRHSFLKHSMWTNQEKHKTTAKVAAVCKMSTHRGAKARLLPSAFRPGRMSMSRYL